MNIFAEFQLVVEQEVAALVSAGQLPQGLDLSKLTVEPPRDPTHGDISTNAAMVLAKPAGKNPRAVAEALLPRLLHHVDVASGAIAGPGFINVTLKPAVWPRLLQDALDHKERFGSSYLGQNLKVNVEYVSANPTGPLHVGHCRGAVFGDALAALLTFTGHNVTKEYYINDAGAQVDVLAQSAFVRYREALGENIGEIPAGLYPGDYLKPVGVALAEEFGKSLLNKNEWLPLVRDKSIAMMMELIRGDLAALDIKQENFFSEKSLQESGAVEKALAELEAQDLIYVGKLPPPKGEAPLDWEDRDQTLFRASNFGDDRDRPLKKSDGSYTYFASDVAYMKNKIDRSFKQMIFVLGADHGGYVKRLGAVAKAFAGDAVEVDVKLCQLVKLLRNGEPVKMSKRAGEFITLRDVVNEVGPDVVRFMMLYRKNEAPLDFDFAKVTEQSKDNPVFYVQYAHARISSVLRNANNRLKGTINFSLLQDEAEKTLIRRVVEFPRQVEAAAKAHEPHRIAFYLYDIASDFHSLWNRGKELPHLRFIVDENVEVTSTRLAFLTTIRYCIGNGLRLLGVRPVEEM